MIIIKYCVIYKHCYCDYFYTNCYSCLAVNKRLKEFHNRFTHREILSQAQQNNEIDGKVKYTSDNFCYNNTIFCKYAIEEESFFANKLYESL